MGEVSVSLVQTVLPDFLIKAIETQDKKMAHERVQAVMPFELKSIQ